EEDPAQFGERYIRDGSVWIHHYRDRLTRAGPAPLRIGMTERDAQHQRATEHHMHERSRKRCAHSVSRYALLLHHGCAGLWSPPPRLGTVKLTCTYAPLDQLYVSNR